MHYGFKQNTNRYQYQLIYESARNLVAIIPYKQPSYVYFVLINNALDMNAVYVYAVRWTVCALEWMRNVNSVRDNACKFSTRGADDAAVAGVGRL